MLRFKNPDPVPDPDMKHWIQFKSRGAEPGTFEAAPILTPEILLLPFHSNVFSHLFTVNVENRTDNLVTIG